MFLSLLSLSLFLSFFPSCCAHEPPPHTHTHTYTCIYRYSRRTLRESGKSCTHSLPSLHRKLTREGNVAGGRKLSPCQIETGILSASSAARPIARGLARREISSKIYPLAVHTRSRSLFVPPLERERLLREFPGSSSGSEICGTSISVAHDSVSTSRRIAYREIANRGCYVDFPLTRVIAEIASFRAPGGIREGNSRLSGICARVDRAKSPARPFRRARCALSRATGKIYTTIYTGADSRVKWFTYGIYGRVHTRSYEQAATVVTRLNAGNRSRSTAIVVL